MAMLARNFKTYAGHLVLYIQRLQLTEHVAEGVGKRRRRTRKSFPFARTMAPRPVLFFSC